jgi:hypothetical protein
MPVNDVHATNFLYRFEAGSAVIGLTNIAVDQQYNGENYTAIQLTHTAPTFSGEAADAEIDVTIHEATELSDLFINGPAPYPIILRIYDYDRDTGLATPYYRGWVVRVPFRLTDSLVVLRCKSVWHFFERESLSDSLSPLSRYSVYDPRAGVDIESLRLGITIATLNDQRDVLTVTGITEPDTWFRGGMIVAPDRNKRTIIEQIGATLTLNAAFPLFTLAAGFTADIYPGDDLTYDTWANKYGAQTNNGEAWGGWQYTPNVDPEVRGVI